MRERVLIAYSPSYGLQDTLLMNLMAVQSYMADHDDDCSTVENHEESEPVYIY